MFRRLVLYSLLTCAPAVMAAEALDVEALVANVEPAVAVIRGITSTGAPVQTSGCCVHADGVILTTAHLILEAKNLHATFADGREFALKLAVSDPMLDLAIFRTDKPVGQAARLGSMELLGKGAPLVAITTPKGLDFSVATGILSGVNRTYKERPVVQTTLPLDQGSSGGPVFDCDGLLAGVVFGRIEGVTGGTLLYPVNSFFTALRGLGLPVPPSGARRKHPEAAAAFEKGLAAETNPEREAAFTEALALWPEFYEAALNLGAARASMGMNDEAAAAFEKACALRPEAPEAWAGLARVHLAAGRPAKAVECFQKRADLLPDDAGALNDLGEALRRDGDHVNAISSFQKALANDATHEKARFNLALALMQSGESGKAAIHFHKVLEQHPGGTAATEARRLLDSLETAKPSS